MRSRAGARTHTRERELAIVAGNPNCVFKFASRNIPEPYEITTRRASDRQGLYPAGRNRHRKFDDVFEIYPIDRRHKGR